MARADEAKDEAKNDDDDASDGEPFVDMIAACKVYFGDPDDLPLLEQFAAEHGRAFAHRQSLDCADEEQDLAHTALHAAYLVKWERCVEAFLRDRGYALLEFQEQLRDAVEDRFCALFEEHAHHGWVDSCFAAVSYEHFYRRMVAASRKRHK
jgi:hypothetical protein